MMRRALALIALTCMAIIGWWAYTTYARTSGQPTAAERPPMAQSATQDSVAAVENVIWASGRLVPLRWAALSPAVGGRIVTIAVAEGDWVEAGALLMALDNGVLQGQRDVAAAALAEAQAAYDKLLAGATTAELASAASHTASAQAAVAAAQAQLLQIQAGVASARAHVTIAQAQYNDLASRPTLAEMAAARAELGVAEAAVNQAQASYNLVRGDPNIGSRPEALALQQATEAMKAAQARFGLTTQGATREALAVANAQIVAAQARVNEVQSQQPAAEAALQSAQAQLDQTAVTAPFAGQVGSLPLNLGELAMPGQPLVLLGDTRQMQVETTDLRETDVAAVGLEMAVEVSFDALPDQLFQGRVIRIAPMSSTDKGSTNYRVLVEVSDLNPNLRWGMTAFVNIQAR